MNKIILNDIQYCPENWNCPDDRFIIYWSDSDGNDYDLEITLGKKIPKALSDALEEYMSKHKDG